MSTENLEKNAIDITEEVEDITGDKKTEPVEIDPNLLLDSIDEVDILVKSHVALLKAMKRLIWKYAQAGVEPEKCVAIAYMLNKRAANKAANLVPNGTPEEDEITAETEDKDSEKVD